MPKRAKSAPRAKYITLLISPILQIFANHYLRCHLYFPQGEQKHEKVCNRLTTTASKMEKKRKKGGRGVYTIELQTQQLLRSTARFDRGAIPHVQPRSVCSSLKHEATVKVRRIALLAAASSASSVRPPPPPQASPGPIGGCRYCSCLLPQTASPRRRDSAQLNPLRRILTKHGEELGKRWGINDSYMRHLPLSTSPITTATMRTTIQLHEVSRDA